MVKIERSFPAPGSLAEEAKKVNGRYDKQDVIEQLRNDFHNKCYICEIKELQDPNVEHLLPTKTVVGNCQITLGTHKKTMHRASVAIALLSEYWNQGIGTRLFEELIKIAQGREGLLQLELEFIEGNIRARHLYEKMGFRITGMRPDAIRLKDGTLLNEYMMVRKMKTP